MKTRSKTIPLRALGALLAVFTSLTISAQGSEILPSATVDPVTGVVRPVEGSEILQPSPVDPVTGAVRPVEPIPFEADVSAHRLDVDFDGLPLLEVVRWLRNVPEFSTVNFVLSPRLRSYGERDDAAINLKLRSAGLRDILNAIGIATDNKVRFEVRTPTLVALTPDNAMEAAPNADLAAVTQPPPSYQMMNLRDQLRLKDRDTIEPVLVMIRDLVTQTLQAIHGNSTLSPNLNYHPGSGILVIVGQPEAIKIAMDVIRNFHLPEAQSN